MGVLLGQQYSLGSTWLGFWDISMMPQEVEIYRCYEGHILRELQGIVSELCIFRVVWAWKFPSDVVCLVSG